MILGSENQPETRGKTSKEVGIEASKAPHPSSPKKIAGVAFIAVGAFGLVAYMMMGTSTEDAEKASSPVGVGHPSALPSLTVKDTSIITDKTLAEEAQDRNPSIDQRLEQAKSAQGMFETKGGTPEWSSGVLEEVALSTGSPIKILGQPVTKAEIELYEAPQDSAQSQQNLKQKEKTGLLDSLKDKAAGGFAGLLKSNAVKGAVKDVVKESMTGGSGGN